MDRRRSATLIPEIYKATVDPANWDYVLEEVAVLTNSKMACLYYLDKHEGIASTIAQFGCPTHMIQNYNKQFEKLDRLFDKTSSDAEKNDSLCQFFSPGINGHSDVESEFYENWMKPEGIYYLGRIQFLNNESHKAAIAVLRDEETGAWGKGDIRVINDIVPHLKRALDIHAEFTRLRLKQDALLKGLDRLVIGIILYDRNAQAVYINPTAKAIIEEHPALSLGKEGLFLLNSKDDKELRRTIKQTALVDSGDSWKQSISIGVTHPDVSAPLPLLVTPLHAHLLTSDLDYEGAKVAVFLSDSGLDQPISVDNLVSVYNLTPSEAQVAISIANGHSIDNIATTSNHSAHTIRSQLKSIFRKTGVSRQSELIKLLLTGPFAHRRRSKAG
ncbi:MAG: helix-turn-helix transcriptional regulator [Gammaproteobacteria bacterium]|nr:helix-turn-helix transcriptional regulator [Gammaproteobacteria bacterium]